MGAYLQHKCCLPRAPKFFVAPIPALETDLCLSLGAGQRLPRLWKHLTRNVHRSQSVISKRPSHCRALLVLALVAFLVVRRSPRSHTCVWFLGWETKAALVLLSCESASVSRIASAVPRECWEMTRCVPGGRVRGTTPSISARCVDRAGPRGPSGLFRATGPSLFEVIVTWFPSTSS